MALTDDAREKIKAMIRSGELVPGGKLPAEAQLADRLGLSRNSLREAVKALEAMRVLEVRRGDGTYVTNLEPSEALESMSFVLDLQDDDSLIEMLVVRRALEGLAASMATERATEKDIAHLRMLVESSSETPDIEELVRRDLEFHRAIAQLADNRYLTGLLDNLAGGTFRARTWRGLTESDAVERTLREHSAIVDAIELGDTSLVTAQMGVHVAGVERWIRGARHPSAIHP